MQGKAIGFYRRFVPILVLTVSVLSASLSATATPTTGSVICGTVESDTGMPLPATVELWDSYPDGQIVGSTEANVDGVFCVEADPGTYILRAYYSGHCTNTFPETIVPATGAVVMLDELPQPVVTPSVVDYWGTNATLEGYPLQPGDVITAFDPNGAFCGITQVEEPGQYVIHVYGDDLSTTPMFDEGAETGDEITFYINCECPIEAENFWMNHAFFNEDLHFTCYRTQTIPLCAPWILMSYNVEVEDQRREVVLKSIDNHYYQIISSLCGHGAISWDTSRPAGLNDLEYMDNEHGYWLYTDGTVNKVSITGLPVPPDRPLELCAGWNVISYVPNEPDHKDHAWNSIAGLYDYAFGFECVTGARTYDRDRPAELNDLTCLYPGHGYWIRMNEPGTLVYPTEDYNCPPESGSPKVVNNVANLSVTRFVSDFWHPGGVLPANVSVSVFDEDGILCGQAVTTAAGGLLVHVYGDDPTTTRDEGAEEGTLLTFQSQYLDLDLRETPVWTHRGSQILLFRKPVGTVNNPPTQFELFQNYPNPFNAETVIRFTLPENSDWELEIFDILGRQQHYEAGFSNPGTVSITWDAFNLPSGIYFYQLTAGELVLSRKMTLLK